VKRCNKSRAELMSRRRKVQAGTLDDDDDDDYLDSRFLEANFDNDMPFDDRDVIGASGDRGARYVNRGSQKNATRKKKTSAGDSDTSQVPVSTAQRCVDASNDINSREDLIRELKKLKSVRFDGELHIGASEFVSQYVTREVAALHVKTPLRSELAQNNDLSSNKLFSVEVGKCIETFITQCIISQCQGHISRVRTLTNLFPFLHMIPFLLRRHGVTDTSHKITPSFALSQVPCVIESVVTVSKNLFSTADLVIVYPEQSGRCIVQIYELKFTQFPKAVLIPSLLDTITERYTIGPSNTIDLITCDIDVTCLRHLHFLQYAFIQMLPLAKWIESSPFYKNSRCSLVGVVFVIGEDFIFVCQMKNIVTNTQGLCTDINIDIL